MLDRRELRAELNFKRDTLKRLRQTLDKYEDMQRWFGGSLFGGYSDELLTKLLADMTTLTEQIALLQQTLQETRWAMLEQFGSEAIHTAFKDAEPGINADTTLALLLEKRRIVYYDLYPQVDIRFIDAVSNIVRIERKECQLRLFSDGRRFLALGFAPEINTIFWYWES